MRFEKHIFIEATNFIPFRQILRLLPSTFWNPTVKKSGIVSVSGTGLGSKLPNSSLPIERRADSISEMEFSPFSRAVLITVCIF